MRQTMTSYELKYHFILKLCDLSTGRGFLMIQERDLLGYLARNPYTKPIIKLPIVNRDMPYFTWICCICLDLSAEKVCSWKSNLSIHAFLPHESRKIIVHYITTIPPPKETRLEKSKFMVSHLIIWDKHWSGTRPSAFLIFNTDIQVTAISGSRLVWYRS